MTVNRREQKKSVDRYLGNSKAIQEEEKRRRSMRARARKETIEESNEAYRRDKEIADRKRHRESKERHSSTESVIRQQFPIAKLDLRSVIQSISRQTGTRRKGTVNSDSFSGLRELPFRFSVKIVTRNQGRSVVAAAAYRSGENLKDKMYGVQHDYRKKRGVYYSEINLPDNAPQWMRNRGCLWNAVEASEKRKDAQLAREFQMSLPFELFNESGEEAIRLVRGFALSLADLGMVVDWSIHQPHKGNDLRNVHAHILATTRVIDSSSPCGFGNKQRDWNDRRYLKKWRKSWEKRTNRALHKANITAVVSSKSYQDRGSAKVAEPKLGPWLSAKIRSAFLRIDDGEVDAGRQQLDVIAKRYDRAADYFKVKTHNLRLDEWSKINEELEQLAYIGLSKTGGHDKCSKESIPVGRGDERNPDENIRCHSERDVERENDLDGREFADSNNYNDGPTF